MLKSQMSFNRMIESTASELQTVGLNSRYNIASFKQNGLYFNLLKITIF